TEGMLTFAPFETYKTIVLPLIQDSVYRGKPHFFVTLSAPSIPASLDRPLQVDIYDRDSGLIMGPFLRRQDGTGELEYDIIGFGSPGPYILRQSQDLNNWSDVPAELLGGGFLEAWQDAISPRFIRLGPNQHRSFYRLFPLGWSNGKANP